MENTKQNASRIAKRLLASAALAATMLSIAGPSTGVAFAAGRLNLICSTDELMCGLMKTRFEEETGVSVNMIRLGSGEAFARIKAEARNPKTDVWWGGTGDPHLQAASEGLTQEYKSPKLDELHDWAKKQAEVSGYKTVGIYTGALGWGYNTKLVAEKGLKEPLCWADLLDPAYADEIQMPNPSSSGTGYTALGTLAQLMGEDKAFEYLKALGKNISNYTKSGQAPVTAAARGETTVGIVFLGTAVAQNLEGFPIKAVVPCEGTGYEVGSMSIVAGARNLDSAKIWYDWALSAKPQTYLRDGKNYMFPANKNSAVPPELPALSDIKLLDYDFKTYGSSEMRQHLLQRWETEVGSASK